MLAFFTSKLGGTLALVVVGLIALAVVSRNWSCKPVKPPKPPRSYTFTVSSVPNGTTILAAGRRGRTTTITLQDVFAPTDDYAEASRANLERLTGKQIRVECERTGLFRGTEDESSGDSGELEARGPVVGVCYGESGACLQISQLLDGYVKCLPTAPALWKAEQEKAKKAKVGMWGEK
jgi:endonuclease YncB( thermonuclease family)